MDSDRTHLDLTNIDLAEVAARFAARLRAEGLAVGPDRSTRFAAAVATVDPRDQRQLYWCGRVTLVAGVSEIPTFDRVFGQVFGEHPSADDQGSARRQADRSADGPAVQPPPTAPRRPVPGGWAMGIASTQDSGEKPEDDSASPTFAAAAERLGSRDFATLSPAELARLAALMRQLQLATPRRRSRRYRSGSRGRRVDLRATLRRALRTSGIPLRLARRQVKPRPRRLVVLCDISGSMAPYARAMLQLVYSAAATGPRTEVFTFATRLTRLTRVLARVRPEVALERAGKAAPDWSGGTRIGEALKAFLDRYGSRGVARGAVVLIISDGWETGDAALLGQQMARLKRLAYRIVWANPRTASPRYQPLVAGMAAAWPYCDAIVSAHSFESLDDLLAALGR